MRRLVSVILLLVLVTVIQSRGDEEEATTEPGDEPAQIEEGDEPNSDDGGKDESSKELTIPEMPNQFWGTVNGAWSMNFTDFNGLRIGGTLNAGLGWFHLGAGYAFTPGRLSYEDVDGDFNISHFFGMIGIRYADVNGHSAASGIHLGGSSLMADLEDDEQAMNGNITVFHYGVYGDYNLSLSESLAFNIHIRTDYMTLDGVSTKLYGLGVGLTFFF